MDGNGGAIYIARGFYTVTVNMSTFIDSRVTRKGRYGGAIYFSRPNYVTVISDSYFISNSASRGGALSVVNNHLSQFYITRITNSIYLRATKHWTVVEWPSLVTFVF